MKDQLVVLLVGFDSVASVNVVGEEDLVLLFRLAERKSSGLHGRA